MRRVNGCFFPMFYLYSVVLICIRIGTCVVILASPRTANTFLHIYESQDNSLDSLAMLNTAAKSSSFVFGCIIVSTLYNTILILRHVHLHQLEQIQVTRRRTACNLFLTCLVLLSLSTGILLYTVNGWTVRYNAITDTSLFGLLAIMYIAVVCQLFKRLN